MFAVSGESVVCGYMCPFGRDRECYSNSWTERRRRRLGDVTESWHQRPAHLRKEGWRDGGGRRGGARGESTDTCTKGLRGSRGRGTDLHEGSEGIGKAGGGGGLRLAHNGGAGGE